MASVSELKDETATFVRIMGELDHVERTSDGLAKWFASLPPNCAQRLVRKALQSELRSSCPASKSFLHDIEKSLYSMKNGTVSRQKHEISANGALIVLPDDITFHMIHFLEVDDKLVLGCKSAFCTIDARSCGLS